MKKILLAEDELHMVRLVQFNLEKAGYSVITAKNGAEALEILKKEKVDLIIADVMMPEIDGLELCRRVKTQLKQCPVILLTARAQFKDKKSGENAGADRYITKPFQPKELITIVNEILK